MTNPREITIKLSLHDAASVASWLRNYAASAVAQPWANLLDERCRDTHALAQKFLAIAERRRPSPSPFYRSSTYTIQLARDDAAWFAAQAPRKHKMIGASSRSPMMPPAVVNLCMQCYDKVGRKRGRPALTPEALADAVGRRGMELRHRKRLIRRQRLEEQRAGIAAKYAAILASAISEADKST